MYNIIYICVCVCVCVCGMVVLKNAIIALQNHRYEITCV